MAKKKGGGDSANNNNNNNNNKNNNRIKTRGKDNDDSARPTPPAPGRKQKGNRQNKNKRSSKNHAGVYDARLRQLIEADGTKSVIQMAADGNCMFRSLSDQLYHDYGNRHEQIRVEISDFLEAHKNEFSVFLVLDDDDDDDDDHRRQDTKKSDAQDDEVCSSFEEYVDKMRQDGEWGGNVELVVAARLYRRNITVYSASLAAFTIDHGHVNKTPAGPDLLLSYHDNQHYNSVRDNAAKGKPPPPIKTFVKGEVIDSTTAAAAAAAAAAVHDDDAPSVGSGASQALNRSPPPQARSSIQTKKGGARQHSAEKKAKDDENNKGRSALPGDSQVVLNENGLVWKHENGATDVNEEDEDEVNNNKKQTKPKRSAPCPCGSGLRYKKCCMSREKHNARVQRIQQQQNQGDDDDDEHQQGNRLELVGEFRVLKI